jgi:hypothetical protein
VNIDIRDTFQTIPPEPPPGIDHIGAFGRNEGSFPELRVGGCIHPTVASLDQVDRLADAVL